MNWQWRTTRPQPISIGLSALKPAGGMAGSCGSPLFFGPDAVTGRSVATPQYHLQALEAACFLPILGNNMPAMGRIASTLPAGGKAVRRSDAPPSLADALFTTTQQRVLALLFGQPARSFFASELIRLTGSGSGAVQRELKRLVSSGLVTVQHIGRQKHFQANPDCPVFDELCAMVRKTIAMVEPVRQALEPLAKRISLALIYGSVAKGADTASSDIDLLVVADELTLEAVFSALAPVEANLARKISPTLYTTTEFESRRAARNPFLTRVIEGEHLMLIGDEDAAR